MTLIFEYEDFEGSHEVDSYSKFCLINLLPTISPVQNALNLH